MAKILLATLALCAVASALPDPSARGYVREYPHPVDTSLATSGLGKMQAALQTKDSLAQINLADDQSRLGTIQDILHKALGTIDNVAQEAFRSVSDRYNFDPYYDTYGRFESYGQFDSYGNRRNDYEGNRRNDRNGNRQNGRDGTSRKDRDGSRQNDGVTVPALILESPNQSQNTEVNNFAVAVNNNQQ
ncbi:ATP-dependent RNA helicase DDX42 [Frankliniella fusca]|uniref:ATP-dependent RNA helicase DDX42 n=1 Tax=Frankliniella fusca TaxID=407009 RepID=A0AAE1GZ07_9NEOP|nr:ATP-dependent RNA helicase DDX42 [Frankliniella fusca]